MELVERIFAVLQHSLFPEKSLFKAGIGWLFYLPGKFPMRHILELADKKHVVPKPLGTNSSAGTIIGIHSAVASSCTEKEANDHCWYHWPSLS